MRLSDTERESKAMDFTVKYRYEIRMTDVVSKRSLVLDKWLGDHFEDIYNGQTILVSPIYRYRNIIFLQPLLDIDTTLEKALDYSKEFLSRCRYKLWSVEFTGAVSVHIVGGFLIKIGTIYDNIKTIREKFFDPIDPPDFVDQVSSVRDMPTLRIGYRRDKRKLAFPLPRNRMNREYIEEHKSEKSFSDIMTKPQLKAYIKKFILPERVVEYDSFKSSLLKK